jgi:hypothetical protein
VASLTAPAANATASVQATTPGQYRPGGTSSYLGSIPAQNMEVATRPAPPAATIPATSVGSPSNGITPSPPATPTSSPVGQRY